MDQLQLDTIKACNDVKVAIDKWLASEISAEELFRAFSDAKELIAEFIWLREK